MALPSERLPENGDEKIFTERIISLTEPVVADTQERTEASTDEDKKVLWVDWEGADDPLNPKNWPYNQRWAVTIVVSLFAFISPISSSMVAPATRQLADEFGIESPALIAMTTSVFVLGYAFGPLFLGPLSEMCVGFFTPRIPLHMAEKMNEVWNLACGLAQNQSQLIAFRFLSGLGGGAPLVIGGGVIGDLWRTEERGQAVAIYSLAPLLGPVLGPVCGGWIAKKSTWRWVFWATSIGDVLILILALHFLRESYAPVILEKKAQYLRKSTDLERGRYKRILTIYDTSSDRSWQRIFRRSLMRPFQMFYQEPIVYVLAIYMAFVYGIYYIFLTTMPTIYANVYHEDAGIGGLNYIALGAGLTISSQLNARCMDSIYLYFKTKNEGIGEPEFRLPSMVPGSILVPFGLVICGWASEKHVHWIVTDIGIGCVGAGLILVFQAIQAYVVDTFTVKAASALAAVSVLRSLAGYGFPLLAPAMYAKLGYGNGDTILAACAICLGCPAPIFLWKYGHRIRLSSKNAHKP